MNYQALIQKMTEAVTESGTEKMLIKVSVPPDVELSEDNYTHLEVSDVSVYLYRDPGEENWVLYITTKGQ